MASYPIVDATEPDLIGGTLSVTRHTYLGGVIGRQFVITYESDGRQIELDFSWVP